MSRNGSMYEETAEAVKPFNSLVMDGVRRLREDNIGSFMNYGEAPLVH